MSYPSLTVQKFKQ